MPEGGDEGVGGVLGFEGGFGDGLGHIFTGFGFLDGCGDVQQELKECFAILASWYVLQESGT